MQTLVCGLAFARSRSNLAVMARLAVRAGPGADNHVCCLQDVLLSSFASGQKPSLL